MGNAAEDTRLGSAPVDAGNAGTADAMRARRLFLDDQHIGAMHNLIRQFHPATKHPTNPLIVPDQPWERSMGHNSGTVLYADGKFKYWYQAFTLPGTCADTAGTTHAAYAESSDGVQWSKPELNVVRLQSGHPNNLVATDAGWVNIVHDVHETEPARRYKLFTYSAGKPKPGARDGWMGVPGNWGWCAFFSPDGLHWQAHAENPVYTAAGDVANLFGWDEARGEYVVYTRPIPYQPPPDEAGPDADGVPSHRSGSHKDGPPVDDAMRRFPRRRLIGRATSADFLEWGSTRTVLTPNAFDPPATEFYGMAVFRYHMYYLGLVYVLRADPAEEHSRSTGLMDTELVVSHDGVQWTRLGGQQPFIARGPQGSFDMGMVGPNNGLVENDGKLWFYYNGWTGEHWETKAYRRAQSPGLWEMGRLGSGTGLAQLRQDGFISVDAGEDEGTLTTPLERLDRGCVVINATTAGPAGYVAAEVVARDGGAVPGFGPQECDRFAGDSVRHVLTWRGQQTNDLPAGAFALRFTMRQASLYSYAIEARR